MGFYEAERRARREGVVGARRQGVRVARRAARRRRRGERRRAHARALRRRARRRSSAGCTCSSRSRSPRRSRRRTGFSRSRERTGAVVQTGHVERFNRAVRAALPFVDSPRFIESNRLAPFNPRGSDVAVVLDLMIHDIDLVRTFVGGAVSVGVGRRRPGAHAVRRHRERAADVRGGRGREHHGEPRVARTTAQASNLSANRISLARSRRGNGRVLSVAQRCRFWRARARRAGRAGARVVRRARRRSMRPKANRCGSSSRRSSRLLPARRRLP